MSHKTGDADVVLEEEQNVLLVIEMWDRPGWNWKLLDTTPQCSPSRVQFCRLGLWKAWCSEIMINTHALVNSLEQSCTWNQSQNCTTGSTMLCLCVWIPSKAPHEDSRLLMALVQKGGRGREGGMWVRGLTFSLCTSVFELLIMET